MTENLILLSQYNMIVIYNKPKINRLRQISQVLLLYYTKC